MTIAIAISISEGLVLAADSRTTERRQVEGATWLDIATDRANKVFPLSRRTGAVTYGRSQINHHTIASLANRFRWARGSDACEDISEVVNAFALFLRQTWEAEFGPVPENASGETIGLLIGGYSADGVGRLYELVLPDGDSRVLSTTETPNYHWRGQGRAVTRLMKGIDPRIDPSRLDPETAQALVRLEYAVRLRHMSLQDAIDFVRLLGETAMGIDRFTSGTVGDSDWSFVGGHLTIATVTFEAFRWV